MDDRRIADYGTPLPSPIARMMLFLSAPRAAEKVYISDQLGVGLKSALSLHYPHIYFTEQFHEADLFIFSGKENVAMSYAFQKFFLERLEGRPMVILVPNEEPEVLRLKQLAFHRRSRHYNWLRGHCLSVLNPRVMKK